MSFIIAPGQSVARSDVAGSSVRRGFGGRRGVALGRRLRRFRGVGRRRRGCRRRGLRPLRGGRLRRRSDVDPERALDLLLRAPELGQAPAERTGDVPDLVRGQRFGGGGRRRRAAPGSLAAGFGSVARPSAEPVAAPRPGAGAPELPFGGSSSRLTWIVRFTSSCALRSSRRPRPIDRPSAGSRCGPTTIRAMTRMIKSSCGPMFSISLCAPDGAPDGAPGRRSGGGRPS